MAINRHIHLTENKETNERRSLSFPFYKALVFHYTNPCVFTVALHNLSACTQLAHPAVAGNQL